MKRQSPSTEEKLEQAAKRSLSGENLEVEEVEKTSVFTRQDFHALVKKAATTPSPKPATKAK